ncbi:TfoX/Sxy family DNA transformation protein [uncultured Clostridium sp.]|uniref:TfoX/Sxy family DNA transformation protein n=1 Tax=uncultured Clostridium sp. TaxID=59620 RepID=UPI0025CDBE48|nr:TfoX/Sxy family DNA transformation protein [uncultured Clostridium sp.]
MSELTSMMNIGKEMAKKLTSVGIDSAEKLIEAGSKQSFLKLKETYPNVCLVHLYTLEGAIRNVEFNRLSEDKKKELKEFSDFLNSVPPAC